MLHLPRPIIPVLRPFRAAFRAKTWDRAQLLVIGAVVAPGQRTVTSALRIMGLRHERQFQRYHLQRGQRHKRLPAWGRQMIAQLRRWLPDRELIVVADSTYAALDLLAACQRLVPLPHGSRACAWMRPCMIPPRRRPGSGADPTSKAHANRPWPGVRSTRRRPGMP